MRTWAPSQGEELASAAMELAEAPALSEQTPELRAGSRAWCCWLGSEGAGPFLVGWLWADLC